MKIWIVSLFDPTVADQTRPMRFQSLAVHAVKEGHNVTYFSNTFRHSTKKYRFQKQTIIESNPLFRTVFIESPAYKKNASIQRFLSNKKYSSNLKVFIIGEDELPDIIVSAMPPIFVNHMLSKFAERNNIPFVIDIIDPWPDVFKEFLPQNLRKFSTLLFGFHRSLMRKTLNSAAGVIAISHKYIQWAEELSSISFKNKEVFYPSIDLEDYQQKLEAYSSCRQNDGILRIVYAGNLGISYDLECILKSAEYLSAKFPGKTMFYIAGAGIQEKEIIEYEKSHDNLRFLGRLNQEDLFKTYAICDLGLAQYRINATQSVTYKLFDYLGSGLPVLNSLQSEMATLIDVNNVGLNNEPGDYTKLANNIISFFDEKKLSSYKRNAKKFTEAKGDSRIVYLNYLGFLEKII